VCGVKFDTRATDQDLEKDTIFRRRLVVFKMNMLWEVACKGIS
jgi:hypothetical protein